MILSPTIGVVTNIDHEHLDHYGDIHSLRKAFVNFINKIPFYGLAVLCFDNEEIQGIIPQLKKRYVTYGLSTQADLRAKDIVRNRLETRFEVITKTQSLGQVTVGFRGSTMSSIPTLPYVSALNYNLYGRHQDRVAQPGRIEEAIPGEGGEKRHSCHG
jgi:UDP-N-acetylmuramate-alanine ligase